MSPLTTEQEHQLVGFITEDFGADLNHDSFTEAALQSFEDIAGLDSVNESVTQPIINRLWRIYDEQR
jgi:hypothetical protein